MVDGPLSGAVGWCSCGSAAALAPEHLLRRAGRSALGVVDLAVLGVVRHVPPRVRLLLVEGLAELALHLLAGPLSPGLLCPGLLAVTGLGHGASCSSDCLPQRSGWAVRPAGQWVPALHPAQLPTTG